MSAPGAGSCEGGRAARSFAQAQASIEKLRNPGLTAHDACGAEFGNQLQREVRVNTQLAKELNLNFE